MTLLLNCAVDSIVPINVVCWILVKFSCKGCTLRVAVHNQCWLISLPSFILPLPEIWAKGCWLFLWNCSLYIKLVGQVKYHHRWTLVWNFLLPCKIKQFVTAVSWGQPVDLLSSNRSVPATDWQIIWSHSYWEFSDKIWLFILLGLDTASSDGASVFVYVADIEGLWLD